MAESDLQGNMDRTCGRLVSWGVYNMRYVIGVLLLIFLNAHVSFADCTVQTYKDGNFVSPHVHFSPYAKTYVLVDCLKIVPGDYLLQANWIHHKKGIFRSDRQHVTVGKDGTLSAYFWFRVSRKGPIKSAFTNSDFDDDIFGEWQVEVLLDDEQVGTSDFSIWPETMKE